MPCSTSPIHVTHRLNSSFQRSSVGMHTWRSSVILKIPLIEEVTPSSLTAWTLQFVIPNSTFVIEWPVSVSCYNWRNILIQLYKKQSQPCRTTNVEAITKASFWTERSEVKNPRCLSALDSSLRSEWRTQCFRTHTLRKRSNTNPLTCLLSCT